MSVIQPGDIISVGKLAWQIYEYGWSSELEANVQYAQFGREFKHLAENLGILANVVKTAQKSLSSHGVTNSTEVRWDSESLLEIIGDFHGTLNECNQLLEENKKYCGPPSGPLDNLRWHVFVQPSADRLKHRLQLQNARIQTVLKPFEIDLLTQIHRDLSRQIQHVHGDLRALMGVLVPDLRAELEQKDKLRIDPLPIPPEIERELERVFLDHPCGRQYPPLKDMAGAFVVSMEQSTKDFMPNRTIVESTPSVEQYLNLLKCLYLLKKMEESTELREAPEHSHWPSYVQELKKTLSYECNRFHHKMHEPRFTLEDLDNEALCFWVEEKSDDIDVIHLQVMMEDLVNVPLFTNPSEESKRLRLLRHTNTNDQKYRLIISTEKRQVTRNPPKPVVEDFYVKAAVLEPLYAVPPRKLSPPYNMALGVNDKIFPLAFATLEDGFLFQQGITGFKVTDSYFQPDMKVCFVTKRRGVEKFEDACAQIWIHARLGGSLVIPDSSDSVPSNDAPNYPSSGRHLTVPPNSPGQRHPPPAQSSPDMSGRDRARMPSVSSIKTTATIQSNASSSDTMVTVHSSTGPTKAPVFMQPHKPLLVLLTRDPVTQRCAIDVVSIADDTRPSRQGQSQNVCIVEQAGWWKNYVEARRLWSATRQWDLLWVRADCRKDCKTEVWEKLSRVSFVFPNVEARIEFGGIFCSRRRTVEQEQECMDRGHLGQLGKAAVYYRKKMEKYHEQKYKIVPQVSYDPKG